MNLQNALQKEKILLHTDFFKNIAIYKEELFKWNNVHNLSAVKNEQQLDEYILDSLFPISFLPPINKVLDIGTGAGFPGLILAIAMPNTHFTLVEPLHKRASFLQMQKALLSLENIEVKNCRIEQLKPEIFDLVTSRAVTKTKDLLDMSRPFRTKETLLLFYKGQSVADEIDESLECEIIKKQNRNYLLIKN